MVKKTFADHLTSVGFVMDEAVILGIYCGFTTVEELAGQELSFRLYMERCLPVACNMVAAISPEVLEHFSIFWGETFVEEKIRKRNIRPQELFTYVEKDLLQYFQVNALDPKTDVLLAGFIKDQKSRLVPILSRIHIGGKLRKEKKFFCIGAGRNQAFVFMQKGWENADKVKLGVELVEQALLKASNSDEMSDGTVVVHVLTPNKLETFKNSIAALHRKYDHKRAVVDFGPRPNKRNMSFSGSAFGDFSLSDIERTRSRSLDETQFARFSVSED